MYSGPSGVYMQKLWLLIDSPYLVYRAQYAMKEEEQGAVYGFIQTVLSLRQRFDTDHFAFCFDSSKLRRKTILPTYKQRKVVSEEHEENHRRAKECMKLLRTVVLKELGFKNIFRQTGYEADDIIASIVKKTLKPDEAVIVSSDSDLYQLLRPGVVTYNPTKELITNEESFCNEWYGLTPSQWSLVKAIAGCRSDNIEGVKGVGEKTAAKFLTGNLPEHIKSYDLVFNADNNEIMKRLSLIRLPFKGVHCFPLRSDEGVNWRKVETYTVR
jgi:DNA polymerase I